jgi:antitoxin-like ribbon-helix-helix protein
MTARAQDDRSGLLTRLMSLGARPANPPVAEAHTGRQRARRGSTPIPAHRKNRRAYTVWHDEMTVRQLKQLALERGMTQQDLAVEATNDLFAKYSKPTIAI